MASLLAQQRSFVAALFGANSAADHLLHATTRGTIASGLAIYRNNVYSNYRNVLAHSYPVLQQLVGAEYLHLLSDAYIATTPSNSGDVRDYGARFADFLQQHSVATELPYLPDVARLEWQCQQVLARALSPPPDLSCLQTLPSKHFAGLRVALNQASALLTSPYPVLKIWQLNQPDYTGDEVVNLNQGAAHMLVLRHQDTVSVLALSAAEYTFLSGLQQGHIWATALLAAEEIAPDFDLGTCVLRHVNNGAISRFIV